MPALQIWSLKLLSHQLAFEVSGKARDDSPPTGSDAEVQQSQRKPLEQKAKYRAIPVFSNLKLL